MHKFSMGKENETEDEGMYVHYNHILLSGPSIIVLGNYMTTITMRTRTTTMSMTIILSSYNYMHLQWMESKVKRNCFKMKMCLLGVSIGMLLPSSLPK